MGMGRNLLRRKAVVLVAGALWGVSALAGLSQSSDLYSGAALGATPAAGMTIPEHPAIEKYVTLFTSPGRDRWLTSVVDRASLYVSHILAALQRRGMPAELVFLPVIESAYVVDAVSSAKAVGLWQLTPVGIHGSGLVVDEYVDERRDFWKSTEVALDILQRDYDALGSWELALAAYNAGITRIKRLLAEAETDDYWTLRAGGFLPAQTAEFVPQFLAAVEVYRRRQRLGVTVQLPPPTAWMRVRVPRSVHLPKLSEVAGVPLTDLRAGNRELNYQVTPDWGQGAVASMGSGDAQAGSVSGYWLKVPVESAAALARTLNQPNLGLIASSLHVVGTGDTLWGMAQYYGSRVSLIESYNEGISAESLQIGQAVVIPLLGDPVPPPPRIVDSRPLTLSYTIAAGDTLWALSRRFGTTAERLAAGNNRAVSGVLRPGDVLLVPDLHRVD